MGVDTHVRLKGKIEPEVILDYLRNKYDKNAKMRIDSHEYDFSDCSYGTYDGKEKSIITSGFIDFTYNGNPRNMFYDYTNAKLYENLDYYSELGLEDMVKSEITFLSLGCNEEAVTILKDLCEFFGGWIDENDCDCVPYYPLLKDDNGNRIKVIHITRKELNEKFGGVVIIDD